MQKGYSIHTQLAELELSEGTKNTHSAHDNFRDIQRASSLFPQMKLDVPVFLQHAFL